MISEAKLSAILVSVLAGVGLTLTLNAAFRDLGFALSWTVPVTLVMATSLAFFATDKTKDRGRQQPPHSNTEGR